MNDNLKSEQVDTTTATFVAQKEKDFFENEGEKKGKYGKLDGMAWKCTMGIRDACDGTTVQYSTHTRTYSNRYVAHRYCTIPIRTYSGNGGKIFVLSCDL